MDTDQVRRWVDAYLTAWASNDPADVEALFTADATYRHRPYRPPVVGRDAIVADWLEHLLGVHRVVDAQAVGPGLGLRRGGGGSA